MIYNVSYPEYLNNPRYTVQHTVNLDIMSEGAVVKLGRYDAKGVYNR